MIKSKESENVLTEYDPEPFFALLDLYFGKNKHILVKHHIDSFNQFIEEIIPSILQNGNNIISEKITENKVIRYRLTFDDLSIKPPMMENDEELMYPLDAIQKNLSYSAKYTATITQWQDIIDINTGNTETKMIGTPELDVPIAKIPMMVGSKYCNLTLHPDLSKKHCRYDAGGYFIVNGNEKVVLSVESIIQRKPLIFTQKDQNTISYYARVQSKPVTQFTGNTQVFAIRIRKDNSIVVVVPRFKEVSVFILLRALGLETDEDIVDCVLDMRREKALLNQLLISLNAQNSPAIVREEAIEILTNNLRSTKIFSETDPEIRMQQKKRYLIQILTKEILPHVVSETNDPSIDMLYKAYYICYMIHKLLKCYLKDPKEVDEYHGCDDRDSMINKRIELSGVLLGTLFEQFFKKMINDCNKIFKSKNVDDKKPPNIISHIKPNSIEQGLRQALATGAFGSQSRKGLSQMLNRSNYLQSASYMRRVITPTVDAATNKMTSPRHLHSTHYGSLCPFESPEGAKTGLVKNMAMMVNITINMNSQIPIIQNYLKGKIITLETVNRKKLHSYVKIFINNNWIGVTDKIISIYNDLRKMRFKGELEKTVSLVLNYREKEFHVYTEGGRAIRPYLTVTNNKLNFRPEMLKNVNSWDEFMAKYPEVIEYIDKEEEQNIMLSTFPQYIEKAYQIMKKASIKDPKELDKINRTNRYDDNIYVRYTHCEIHPCMIFGIITSNIPFPDHNQSPRNIYQYNQARHAMGLYSSDYRERVDISYILYHPQIPIVASRASKYTGTHIFPSGENSIVAVASYTGMNQEDSLLMNNSAIEKGFFRAQALKKYFQLITKNPASSQVGIFMKPDRNKVENMKDANYDKLTEEGYVKVETVIKDGDVIIGMVNPKPTTREDEKPYKDNSTIYRSLIPGAIDKVITEVNSDGYPIIKIRVRSERIPMEGDKFSCYDEKTEVLTDKGWIYFQDLKKSHRVATLINGKELVYEHPKEILKYTYKGQMYYVKNNMIDLCVTPNHMMWVSINRNEKFQLIRADKINHKVCRYQKNILFYGSFSEDLFVLPEYDVFKERKIEMMSWLKLFGIWITSGFVDQKSVTIHGSNIGKILVSVCESLNIDVKNEDGTNNWKIYDIQMVKLFSKIDAKTLPPWVWKLPTRYARCLLEGILSGENIREENGTIVYIAKTKELADNIQRLCIHAGWTADILTNEQETSFNLSIMTESTEIIANNTKREDEWVCYNGKIYCCTVSSGVICVRRNGIAIFSGNSRHGQKGTIGARMHRADMMFSKSGLVPDIVINPNCIPTRMTIGQLIECLLGKVCAIKGVYGDGTPFTKVDLEKINKELVEAGYEEWGNETMYNGMTGKKMETKIFIGPTYYQRLKQMAGDKAHSRARGPTQLLTRQAPEGRSRDGGLRLGEMERDALCAHGMAQFLKEKMVDNADIYTTYVCDLCGLFASKVPDKKYYICRSCKNTTRISKIVIPYAFKLFMQELRSINILGRIRTTRSILTPGK
jgi:DNA-directed RNA polymerase II subunit RPB2